MSLERMLGREWGGVMGPPDEHLETRIGPDREYQVRVQDGDLWIGASGEDTWLLVMPRATARQLASFIRWRWFARARWWGLRTALYFWAFRRACWKEARKKVHARARIKETMRRQMEGR